ALYTLSLHDALPISCGFSPGVLSDTTNRGYTRCVSPVEVSGSGGETSSTGTVLVGAPGTWDLGLYQTGTCAPSGRPMPQKKGGATHTQGSREARPPGTRPW